MYKLTYRGYRHPGPVLGPYGYVIGELPGKRGYIDTRHAADEKFDEIPSVQFHGDLPLLMAGKTGVVLLVPHLGVTFGTVIHFHPVPGIALIS